MMTGRPLYHAAYESGLSYPSAPDDFPAHPEKAQRQVSDQETLQISFRFLLLTWHFSVKAVAVSVDSISRGKP